MLRHTIWSRNFFSHSATNFTKRLLNSFAIFERHIIHHPGHLLYFVELFLFCFRSLPNVLGSATFFWIVFITIDYFLVISVFNYHYCPLKTISKLLINKIVMRLLFVIKFIKHFVFFPYQFMNIGSHPCFLDKCCCFREGLIKGHGPPILHKKFHIVIQIANWQR